MGSDRRRCRICCGLAGLGLGPGDRDSLDGSIAVVEWVLKRRSRPVSDTCMKASTGRRGPSRRGTGSRGSGAAQGPPVHHPAIGPTPIDQGLVGARGFEPLTSSASRKRSPPELSARSGEYTRTARGDDRNRTGVPGFADPCLNHSATSPRHHVSGATGGRIRAEDGARTRDLNLGKVALYQLSYFRVGR